MRKVKYSSQHTNSIGMLDILFRQITTFIKVTKIYQLKGLKPKNKDQTNLYECCDLTEKVYLVLRIFTEPFHGVHRRVTTATVIVVLISIRF